MQLIVITSPDQICEEAAIINELFTAGLTRLHLRKPGSSAAQVAKLLGSIKVEFRRRVALHQHHELAAVYGLNHLHYNEQARLQTSVELLASLKQDGYVLSTSVHDKELLPSLSLFDYAFFGPVFDSLCKPGYRGTVSPDFLLDITKSTLKVIALGGVQPSRIPAIKTMGFDGAAVLGAIWKHPEKALITFKNLQASVPVQQHIDP